MYSFMDLYCKDLKQGNHVSDGSGAMLCVEFCTMYTVCCTDATCRSPKHGEDGERATRVQETLSANATQSNAFGTRCSDLVASGVTLFSLKLVNSTRRKHAQWTRPQHKRFKLAQ